MIVTGEDTLYNCRLILSHYLIKLRMFLKSGSPTQTGIPGSQLNDD